MASLEEIPGALERPGGCRIEIFQTEDGVATITVPPRGAPIMVIVAGMLLLLNLLIALYMGVMLFFAHKSVLFMAQIAPTDLPVSMRRYTGWLAFGWTFVEALGFWSLALIIRPIITRETLQIGPEGVRQERRSFGRPRRQWIDRQNVQGFHLERDPQGFIAGVLTLQARGEQMVVAEYVTEAEREWLASVGNALLARY